MLLTAVALASSTVAVAATIGFVGLVVPLPVERFAPLNKLHSLVNGDMGPTEVQIFCQLDETGTNLMRAAVQQTNLSTWA